MANPLLVAEDVFKSYQDQDGGAPLEVLKGANLIIEQSTITSIIGSSGSGKSTLLHILGGLDKPDQGKVIWNGNDLASMKEDRLAEFRNKNMGFVFQFHHLLPEFTALENICMPALIAGEAFPKATERALQLMERFGVAERKNHRPTQLSGGEQQRVSMARALMNRPQLILADEPSGNLDDRNTQIILDMLFELRDRDGVAILLITHEKAIADRSDRILELKNGLIN